MVDYKAIMENLRTEIQDRIIKATEDQKGNTNINIEDVDGIQEKSANDILTKIIERDTKKLAQVNKALAMIDLGKYGECQHCGCGISQKRLMAMPLAENCLECQEDLD